MGNGTEDSTSNIESLADQIASLTKAVQRLDKPKDRWDKLAAISALLSGVFIGAAGIVATSLYNNKQLELQDGQERSRQILQKVEQDARLHVSVVEVVEKYFPHLTSDKPTDRRIALGSIAVMDPNLATKLALYIDDPGLAERLKQVTRVHLRTSARTLPGRSES